MRVEPVEIYSDETNGAVIRHPGRRFPGFLMQGDELYSLCWRADQVCLKARPALAQEAYQQLNEIRNALWASLTHYKSVLVDHNLPLPFSEIPPVS
jgi:hypothetical protein